MSRRQQVALAVVRGLVKRPRLGDAVFRFDRWGNILGPDRFVDPYPIYERMRAPGPVSFSPLLQQWAVVGYEEAREVLSSPSFGVAPQMALLLGTPPYSRLADSTKALLRNALLFTDPPLHTRLRAEVARAFGPPQMRRLEPRVRALVDRLLAGIAGDPRPELVAGVAQPLPVQVIAELIGVPEERWSWVQAASDTMRRVVDPFVVLDPAVVDSEAGEFARYANELADERLRTPSDDLMTTLAQAVEAGHLDRSELVSLAAILLLAGHETTTGAIGNAVVALARHPDQRDLVRGNPDLWPNAVEELLRYDTALQTDPRTAQEDVRIGGAEIKRGQNLTVMLGAANRDPRRFDEPDRLRLDRPDPAPISFGHGIHHCVGAALARLELRVALPAIVDALGDYEIAPDDVTWKTSLAFRSPTRLQVTRGR